jgi:hypothetical protein
VRAVIYFKPFSMRRLHCQGGIMYGTHLDFSTTQM